jgi:hypothetical protein
MAAPRPPRVQRKAVRAAVADSLDTRLFEIGRRVRANLLGIEHQFGFGCPLHECEVCSAQLGTATAKRVQYDSTF